MVTIPRLGGAICRPGLNGVGKTSITLKALDVLRRSGVGRRALVVAPLRVATKVWPAEGPEWTGSEWAGINDLRINVLHGSKKEFYAAQDADVYVINFDGLPWLCKDNYRVFKALEIDTLVIDESSKIRNTRTQRFKLLKPVLDSFARRWILTGSPAPKSYLDLFGQVYVLDLGLRLGRFITHYRQNYFEPLDRMGWTWILKREVIVDKNFRPVTEMRKGYRRMPAKEAIEGAVAPYTFRLDAEDYIKMPAFNLNVVRVELPEEAREIYDELEEKFIIELDKVGTVVATSQGSLHGKLCQIANGGLYLAKEEPGKLREWTDLHEAKLDAVTDIVEELQGSPAMIAFEYEHDLARLLKRFGKDTPYIAGGVSPKRSAELMDKWNRDELDKLLVQPQTVSHGLNLQYGTGHHIIGHSLTYDFDVFDQLVRRLRRQGSRAATIFFHAIVARDTLDEAKLRALRKKERDQRGFLDAMKSYAAKRRKMLKIKA